MKSFLKSLPFYIEAEYALSKTKDKQLKQILDKIWTKLKEMKLVPTVVCALYTPETEHDVCSLAQSITSYIASATDRGIQYAPFSVKEEIFIGAKSSSILLEIGYRKILLVVHEKDFEVVHQKLKEIKIPITFLGAVAVKKVKPRKTCEILFPKIQKPS